ncbi:structural maintenance of chromosomes protein 2-like isoform X1 [Clavelina lepadiformis]|uniref:structural maintenance of chromosomes protein 2-like isoform X1 n=2 Tax=Clavelina lepadiformis TaxID=159417 RepID=UPI0040434FD9
MHIKGITIDGFKSYAQRTEINGFDVQFNAITGLNGSGKSNILDAICFLLGITNLSQVRATNLQDLVYKNGQAGINKATVSITFDNSNKEQSPIGMEAHNEITITRQIVIGGRNKYLINGVNAQNVRVSDLFRSVGLNVNNPHFLIMQGRVTKVMNMKPPEILSMIEEATGTSMYESKKESAQRMIEKKENKLTHINRTLNEEITPTLQKLRDERSSYLEYQKIQREVERFSRLRIAHQFLVADQIASSASDEIEKMNEKKAKIENEQDELQVRYEVMGKEIAELENSLDNEAGNKLKDLENVLGDKEKVDAKAHANLRNQKEIINEQNKALKNLEKNKAECQTTVAANKQKCIKTEEECKVAEQESTKHTNEFSSAQKHFEAVTAGLANADNGQESSWNAQLLQAKKDISQLQTDKKQSEMKLKHIKNELKSKQSELKKTDATYKVDEDVLKKAQGVHSELLAELQKLNYEEGLKEELNKRKRDLANKIAHLRKEVQNVYNKFPSLQFHYKDPEKNWDRNRIKGMVAELLDIEDPKYATALEIVAGRRLYNVVVDNHVTGSMLLKQGQLRRRVTIIPLNKVAARSLTTEKINHAKALVGKDNAHLALSLVSGGKEISKALEYVFGTTIVCNNMDCAKKVAFDPKIKARTVTLAGELFDPSGTLSGGSRPRNNSVLAELKKTKSCKEELTQAEMDLRKLEVKLSNESNKAERYRELRNQVDLKEREIKMLQQRLAACTHGQILEQINSLETTKASCEETLSTFQEKMANYQTQVKELERKLADAPAERERELKKAQTEMNKAGKQAEKSNQAAEAKREELNTLKMEIDELEEEFKQYENQITNADEKIKHAKEVFETLNETAKVSSESVKSAKKDLQKQRDYVQSANRDIKRRVKERALILGEVGSCQKRLEHQESAITKHIRDSKDATNKVAAMLEEYEWIENEKSLFGKSGSPYDFQANPPKEVSRRLEKLEETLEKLKNSVNMRAMSLLGKAEEKYNELIKKKKIVENDKAKIQKTIEELDQMKNEAVTKAYAQVNKNFGTIFSTLLPGATAKLAPTEGSNVLAGLEFQVGFGDVWKTNLNELSGGQRSLVALSLILAMLLLKPAPIYILDEVDAALDLSHTQNIGGMLREHFKHSQFIVVSLKDGMFNNANVLFRTRFLDGVSTVSRYTQSSSNKTSSNTLQLNNKQKKK